jgi:mono/diheme cytochrome c family protein
VRCHHSQVGTLRALRLTQLAGTFDGRDQLEALVEIGIVAWREGESSVVTNPYARLDDESAPIEDRARAYLDTNCAACHQPGGNAGEASMDLRRTTPLAMARLCDRAPNATFPGHENASLLKPGEPESSLISIRMKLTDAAAMPPQRHSIDAAGVRVVDAWIASLAACPAP